MVVYLHTIYGYRRDRIVSDCSDGGGHRRRRRRAKRARIDRRKRTPLLADSPCGTQYRAVHRSQAGLPWLRDLCCCPEGVALLEERRATQEKMGRARCHHPVRLPPYHSQAARGGCSLHLRQILPERLRRPEQGLLCRHPRCQHGEPEGHVRSVRLPRRLRFCRLPDWR